MTYWQVRILFSCSGEGVQVMNGNDSGLGNVLHYNKLKVNFLLIYLSRHSYSRNDGDGSGNFADIL
jgi:hypothetical protein